GRRGGHGARDTARHRQVAYSLRDAGAQVGTGGDGGDPMTCEHALDDGAYVLGALSPAERAQFERHLPGCAACRESVAPPALLPGLLGRLDRAGAVALHAGPAPATLSPTVLPRVLAATVRQRRVDERRARRRRTILAAVVAAVVMILLVGVGVTV